MVPSSQSCEEESKLVCAKYAWGCGHVESAKQLLLLFFYPSSNSQALTLFAFNMWQCLGASLLGVSRERVSEASVDAMNDT